MNVPFRMIGVLNRKSPDQDDVAFVPLSTAKLRFLGSASGVNRDAVAYIPAKTQSDEAMARAKTGIEAAAATPPHSGGPGRRFNRVRSSGRHGSAARRDAHRRSPPDRDRLCVAASRRHQHHERLDRIGDRANAGNRHSARRRRAGADIRLQFLSEALLLCLLGGIVGIAGGMAVSLTDPFGGMDHGNRFAGGCLIRGVLGRNGLFFGFYPAHRASKLAPIDALKTE